MAGQHGGAVAVGSVYAGFDDRLASWGKRRIINGNCGDTWLKTFSVAREYQGRYSALQLLTWNDYEEGSEIEPGIDNCVSVRASASEAICGGRSVAANKPFTTLRFGHRVTIVTSGC